jgi:hypothetical protein
MSPVVDQEIPAVTNMAGVRAILGCSHRRAKDLVANGTLASAKVGRQTLVAADDASALARRRARGYEGWELGRRRTVLPRLLSSSQAAGMLGLATPHRVRELYEQGRLPGVTVGDDKDVFFRRQVVEAYALVRRAGVAQREDTDGRKGRGQ